MRQGVWESNSSSTHSYTLCFDSNKTPDSKPIINGPIVVGSGGGTSDVWSSKLADLAAYCRITNKDLNYLVDTIREFCGETVEFDFTMFDAYDTNRWGPMTVEYYFDEFQPSGYCKEYGNRLEDIESQMEDILSTPEKTLAFLFSCGHIECNAWYNG